jgi:hypothetical protein
MPSFMRPASLIIFWFHGGSQTSSHIGFINAVDAQDLALRIVRDAGSIPQPERSASSDVDFRPPLSLFESWQS